MMKKLTPVEIIREKLRKGQKVADVELLSVELKTGFDLLEKQLTRLVNAAAEELKQGTAKEQEELVASTKLTIQKLVGEVGALKEALAQPRPLQLDGPVEFKEPDWLDKFLERLPKEEQEKVVTIAAPVDIKQPAWLRFFSDSKLLNAMTTMTKSIVEAISKQLRVDISLHQSPERALAVKLVDLQGNFYRARGPGGSTGGAAGSVAIDGSATIGSGRQTVPTPGTKVAIGGDVAVRRVIVTAFKGNDTIVYVGGANVSAVEGSEKGVALYAANVVELRVSNLNKIFVDALTADEGVTFYYEV